MERRHTPCFLFFLVVALLVGLPSQAYARTKKRAVCTAHDVRATVVDDGMLLVTETRAMDYVGQHNGLAFVIDQSDEHLGPCEVEVQEVGEVVRGVQEPYASAPLSAKDSAARGSYSIRESSPSTPGVTYVDMHFRKRTEKAQFYVTYRIKGCVVRWADVGELYWRFVGSGWDADTNHVHCEVMLPAPAGFVVQKSENVWAWLHNQSLVGDVTVNEGEVTAAGSHEGGTPGTVVCDAELVQKGRSAELRVLFPAEWLSTIKARDENRRPVVTQEEAALTVENEALRSAGTTSSYIKMAIVVALVGASLGIMFFARKRLGEPREAQFSDAYWRDVPTDDHPAVLARLLDGDASCTPAMTATLVRLAEKGVVSVEQVRDDWRITVDRSRAQELADPIDAGLVGFLFDFVASHVRVSSTRGISARTTNSLLFSEVDRVARENREAYDKRLAGWGKVVMAASDEKGYENGWPTCQRVCHVLGVFDVAVAIMAFIDVGLISKSAYVAAGIPFVVAFACFILLLCVGVVVFDYPKNLSQRSTEALEITAKLGALARWLHDIPWEDEDVPSDVEYWRRMLEASVVVGEEAEVMRQLRAELPGVASSDELATFVRWCSAEEGAESPVRSFRSALQRARRKQG